LRLSRVCQMGEVDLSGLSPLDHQVELTCPRPGKSLFESVIHACGESVRDDRALIPPVPARGADAAGSGRDRTMWRLV
jgi:hypothetical protein